MITFVDVESDLPKDILDEAIKIFLASIAEKTTIKDAIKKVCKSVLMQTVAYLDKIREGVRKKNTYFLWSFAKPPPGPPPPPVWSFYE